MIDVRTVKGLEYSLPLYELESKLYGNLSCPYETYELRVGSSRAR